MIDDDPEDIALLKENLSNTSLNFEITEIHHGREAMDFIEDCAINTSEAFPDFLLVDLRLPEVHGLDLIRAIRQNPKLRLISTLVFSGLENETTIRDSYTAGANCCLKKPSTLQEATILAQAIQNFWFSTLKLPGDCHLAPTNISETSI